MVNVLFFKSTYLLFVYGLDFYIIDKIFEWKIK